MKSCPACKRTFGDEMKVCGVDGSALESISEDAVKADPFIGRTIKGRYQIIKKLGEGGMGAVYLAQQESIGRKVALKLLHGAGSGSDVIFAIWRGGVIETGSYGTPSTDRISRSVLSRD